MAENTGDKNPPHDQGPQHSEEKAKTELFVNLSPILTATRAAMSADPHFHDFRAIAEAELKRQQPQLSSESVEYRVNLQKVERNALTAIFISESVQELFQHTQEHPNIDSGSGDVVWKGTGWEITVDGALHTSQKEIQTLFSQMPDVDMAIYIYHDDPHEQKLYQSMDKPKGFDMLTMHTFVEAGNKKQEYQQSPGLVPIDGYSCVSFAMIRAYDQVLQNYLQEISSNPTHPLFHVVERFQELLSNPNPEEAELDGLFMRYDNIKDFILPAFGFAMEFYAALARFVEAKAAGNVSEEEEAEFFTAFAQALNIPSFIAKYHNAVFHDLIGQLTDGMENAVFHEGALDTKVNRSGKLQFTVSEPITSAAEKFHIPATVTTGCPVLTTDIFKLLLQKYQNYLKTVGYKNLASH